MSTVHTLTNPVSAAAPAGLLVGLFIVGGLTFAGCVHVLWMRSRLSVRFVQPLDGGLRIRGRRLFGPNKTWRGFMAVVPASALGFYLLALALTHLSDAPQRWLWPLSPLQHGLLGLVAGAGLMLGELPNSFVKRQLDIPPGKPPRHPVAAWLFAIIDRFDSLVGALLVLALVAPLPWSAWLVVLLLGPFIHGAFSASLYLLGVKERPT